VTPVKPAGGHRTKSAPLDKASAVPLYFQIQRRLLERIAASELAEGDLLESEEELSRRYRVSRMTARHALTALKDQGYAVSQKGRGTFVSRPKLEKNILHLLGFSEEMKQRGFRPSSRLLEQAAIAADDGLAARLQVAAGDSLLRLLRVRLANDVPMAIETSHVPLARYPGLDRFDFGKRSLYQVLRDRYGMHVAWADEVLEAFPASREQAGLLLVPPRSSLLAITRTIMQADGTPIESAQTLYRGDRYRAVLRVPAGSTR